MIGGSALARRGARGVAGVGLALVLSATSCNDDGAAPARGSDPSPSAAAAPITADDFEAMGFAHPAEVTNRWLPLTPGTEWSFEGHALDEGERISRGVVITVTDLTKVIDGVATRVVWERDYTDGEAEEIELSFYAQDDAGNVWLMGEYPEEYDGKEIVKAPVWLGGLRDALPGIIMLADPHPGMDDYAEGWGPEVHWNDRAFPYQEGQHVCVPVDCYDGVLVIDEFNPGEPGAHQLKYYAAGVGGIRVGWRGPKEEEQEELELVSLRHLTATQLAAVNEQALEQDARGYDTSPDVYGQTDPIEPTT